MKRMSIRVEDSDVVKLEAVMGKREKDTDNKVAMSELIREYVAVGLGSNNTGNSKSAKKNMEESTQKLIKRASTVKGIDIENIEEKIGNIGHDITDMKEMLNNILTTVSYPKDLEKLDEIKVTLDRIAGPAEE